MLAPARARSLGLPRFWDSETGSRCMAGMSPVVCVDVLGVLEEQARRQVRCAQGQGGAAQGEGWSSDVNGSLVQKGPHFPQK